MGSSINRKNWKFSYKLKGVESRGKDLEKWWVMLLFLSIILSCERDTKNRNNCPPLLSESKQDSLLLTDYFFWNWGMWRNGSKEEVSNSMHDYYKSNKYKFFLGNLEINMLADKKLNNVFSFLKIKSDSTCFRYILEDYAFAEDSSELNGEIELYDLEYMIYNNAIDSKFEFYNNRRLPIDTLVLIQTHFANKAYNRIFDYRDTISFKNMNKYDSISLAKLIENNFERMFNYFYYDTPILTRSHYNTLKEYIKSNLKTGYNFNLDKNEHRQTMLNVVFKDMKSKIIEGYKSGLLSFEDFKKNNASNLSEYFIYYSLPDFKFYIVRVKEKPGHKPTIFLRILNSQEAPARAYSFIYGLQLEY